MARIQLDMEKVNQIGSRAAYNGSTAVANAIVHEIRRSWSTRSPSPPGSPPAKDTGTLDRSVHTEKVDETSVAVVAEAPYAFYLEFGTMNQQARPFMRPAVAKVRGSALRTAAEAARKRNLL